MSTTTELPRTLLPYETWGVEFTGDAVGEEHTAYCWACHHDDPKVHINAQTTMYHCKHCGTTGNISTYLTQLTESLCNETTNEDYEWLVSQKSGISKTDLENLRVFRYPTGENEPPCFCFPNYNLRENVTNLRYTHTVTDPDTGEDKLQIRNTPGLGLDLFNTPSLMGKAPVYLVEGEWDCLALVGLARRAKRKLSVLASPGCNTFKKEWITLLENRTVRILFDNDNAGQEGARRTANMLVGHVKNVEILSWPTTAPDGYDLRDFCSEVPDGIPTNNLKTILRELDDMLVPFVADGTGIDTEEEWINPVSRDKFEDVLTDFDNTYHISDETHDALSVMFATLLSTQIPGDPLWVFIVGPPGSGKTLLLRAMEKSPAVVYRSSLTPKSLISGFVPEGGEDPSLIPILQGKTLVLKDYTEITAMASQDQEEIYGILRGAYDGRCDKTFGHGVHREYENCYFGMLAGVTDVIHGNQRAALGERFLKFQMIDNTNHDYDAESHIMAALGAMAEQTANDDFIRNSVASFTDQEIDPSKFPKPGKTVVKKIVALAQLISYLRAQVPRNGNDIAYLASPEIGTRLAKQLLKLAQCLSVVWGNKGKIDERCYKLVQKVALDTARGWKLMMFLHVMERYLHNKYTSRADLMRHTGLPEATSRRHVEDLTLLRVIEPFNKKNNAKGGNPALIYKPTDHILSYWRTAKCSLKHTNN